MCTVCACVMCLLVLCHSGGHINDQECCSERDGGCGK